MDYPALGSYRTLVDLMGHRELGGKTVIFLVDGLFAGHGWSSIPEKWETAPFGDPGNPDWPSSIFLSQDPVAIDSVAYDFLNAEWPTMDGLTNGFFRLTGIPPCTSLLWTATGTFTGGVEGPCMDGDGNLYAMDYETGGTIGKVTPQGRCSLFLTLPPGSKGNGSRFDSVGNMLVTDQSAGRILRVDMTTTTVTEFARHPLMAGPNDLAITSNDVLYVSDPDWSGSNGKIWRVDTNGTVTLPVPDLGPVNGVEISPDGARLYAADATNIWSYEIQSDGSLTNRTVFYTHPSSPLPVSTYDGMRCDREGNLYVAMWIFGKVMQLDASSHEVRDIPMVDTSWRPTNVAFGGPDGRTLYVTVKEGSSATTGHIKMIRVDVPGRRFRE